MKNFRDVCSSAYFLIAAQVILSVVVAAGAIFYTYANVVVFCLWKVVSIDVTFVLCSGATFALVYFEKHPDCKAWHLAFPFCLMNWAMLFIMLVVEAAARQLLI